MANNDYRKLERIIKGFANHRRLEILDLLKRAPEQTIEDISEKLNIGYQNASDHIRKLSIAGLIVKRNNGVTVLHKITPRGDLILVFCKKLE